MNVRAPGGSPLVGRDDVLGRLREHLERARAGGSGLVWVSGEAGIGKTRLLGELADDAGAGTRVVRAAGWGEDGHPAFWLWAQVLRDLAPTVDAERLRRRWGPRSLSALRLLPELADGLPTSLPDGAAERFPLYDAVAAVLEREAADGPLLLLLDDAHWADAASLRVLHYVLGSRLPPGVLVVVGWREHEVEAGGELDRLRQDLLARADPVPLSGLDATEVSRLIELTAGFVPQEAEARDLVARTGGNPLFVSQLGRLARSRGAGGLGRLVPGSAEALLRRRLARVSSQCQDLLVVIAVAGQRPRLELVATVAGLGVGEVADILDEAEREQLAELSGGHAELVHALVRETLLATVPGRRRRELHLACGRALRAEARATEVAEASRHLLAALPLGELDDAVAAGEAAARAAYDAMAYEESAAAYAAVREVLPPGHPRTIPVLLGLGDAVVATGDVDAAREAFTRAAGIARAGGDAVDLARAALGFAAGLSGFEVRLRDQAQNELLEEALATLPAEDSVLRATLMARLSVALSYETDLGRRLGLADEAVAMSRRLEDPRGIAHALAAWCDAVAGPDHVDARRDAATEMLELGARERARDLQLLALRHRVVAHLERGDAEAARQDMDLFASYAEEAGPLYQWYVPLWRGFRAHQQGQLEEVRACAGRARAIGARCGSHNAEVLALVQETWVHAERLQLHELLPLMTEALGALPELAPDGGGLLALHPGQPRHVRRAILPRMEALLTAAPRDAEYLSMLCLAATAVVEGGDEAEYARVLLRQLRPYADLFAIDGIGAASHGSVHRLLGDLCHRAGRLEEAADHFERGIAANERAGSPLHVAHTQASYSRLLGELGDPRAADVRGRARTAYAAMGLTARLERLDALDVAEPPPADGPVPEQGSMVREGQLWRVRFRGEEVVVRHSKGMADLAVLLARPGAEVHALDLATPPGAAPRTGGDLGEVWDERARAEYRSRLVELEDAADRAAEAGRAEEAERLLVEREQLVAALSSAYGLGGRVRRTGSPAERARTTVTSRIRDAIARLETVHPALGRHLRAAVRTGTFCTYEPETPVGWSL